MTDPAFLQIQQPNKDANTIAETRSPQNPATNELNSSQARTLLKDTVELLKHEGLSTVNPARVLANLKQNLPSEHNQINLSINQEQRNQPVQSNQQPYLSDDKINQWSNGQMLQGRVVSSTANSLTISIDHQLLELKLPENSKINFEKGHYLNLQVIKNSPDSAVSEIQLQLKNDQNISNLLALFKKNLTNTNASTSQLLASLDSIDKQISSQAKISYPKEFIDAVQKLLKNFASEQSLSSTEKLKQVISKSGVFLENQIGKLAHIQETMNKNLTEQSQQVSNQLKNVENSAAIDKIKNIPLKNELEQLNKSLSRASENNLLSKEMANKPASEAAQNADKAVNVKEAIAAVKEIFQQIKIDKQSMPVIEQSQKVVQAILSQLQQKPPAGLSIAEVQQITRQLQQVQQSLTQLQTAASNAVTAAATSLPTAQAVVDNAKDKLISQLQSLTQSLTRQPPSVQLSIPPTSPLSQLVEKPLTIPLRDMATVLQTLQQNLQTQSSNLTTLNNSTAPAQSQAAISQTLNQTQQLTQALLSQLQQKPPATMSPLAVQQITQQLQQIQQSVSQLQSANSNAATAAPAALPTMQAAVDSAQTQVLSQLQNLTQTLSRQPPSVQMQLPPTNPIAQAVEKAVTIPLRDMATVLQTLQQNLQTQSSNLLPSTNSTAAAQSQAAISQTLNQTQQLTQALLSQLQQKPPATMSPLAVQQITQQLQQIQQSVSQLQGTNSNAATAAPAVLPTAQAAVDSARTQILSQLQNLTQTLSRQPPSVQMQLPPTNPIAQAVEKPLNIPLRDMAAVVQTLQQSLQTQNTSVSMSSNATAAQTPAAMNQAINQTQQLSQSLLSQLQQSPPANISEPIRQQIMQQLQQVLQSTREFQLQMQQNNLTQNIDSDFKANVERLIHVLKQFPATPKTAQSPINPIPGNTANSDFLREESLPSNNRHAQVVKAAQQTLNTFNQLPQFQQQLLSQLENTLSRLLATQINTREQGEQQNMLSLEIPFRILDKTHIMQMKFAEKQKKHQPEKKIWTANLAFELKSLGAIRIYISLDHPNVAIQFWSEQEKTRDIFQENFTLLSERIAEGGFILSQLAFFHGIPDDAEEEIKQQESHRSKSDLLVDEHV